MYVDIERKTDENTKEVFDFWFYDLRGILYLDVYRIEHRESSRHKFRVVKRYSRLDHQKQGNWVNLEDVPLTEDIKKLALEKLISRIKVDTWKDA